MACRNDEKARRARDKLESELERCVAGGAPPRPGRPGLGPPGGRATSSTSTPRLDLLVNNAGVMGTPYRQTADGFELQMATNHLGPLRPDRAAAGPHRDDGAFAHRHRQLAHAPHRAAASPTTSRRRASTTPGSPTARPSSPTSLFTAELSRRLQAAGLRTMALAAHPGWTRSNLAGSGAASATAACAGKLAGWRVNARAVGRGRRPAGAVRGHLVEPCAAGSTSGRPASPGSTARPGWRSRPVGPATSRWRRDLWEVSEELTGVRYSVPAAV